MSKKSYKQTVMMLLFTVVFFAIALAVDTGAEKGEMLPFQNYNLSFEERTADLVSRLTLEEKVKLLDETSEAIPRLGVPRYHFGNEALHGVVRPGQFTVFPQSTALASTWNDELMYQIATAISDEARGKNNFYKGDVPDLYCGVLSFWSPDINIARDPRWGRTPEAYGEDPHLTSRIAVAFVKGLQGSDPKYIKAISTPKHFIANNEEHNRFECNAIISERAMREYYLPPFEATVKEANAQSIMAAYNATNGIPCNADKWLLTDLLRGEWGFDGYVVTDCGALSTMISGHKYAKTRSESAAFGLNAGVDLECGDQVLKDNLIEALKAGLVTEETIDRAVFRVLRARFRVGMFDPPEMVPYSKISPDVIGSKKHQELARRAAQESIVLLKNEKVADKPLLPLDVENIKSIAVVGPIANICVFGDYSGTPLNEPVTPLQGIKNKVADRIKINHAEWIPAAKDLDYFLLTAENLIPDGGAQGERGFKAEYFNNAHLKGKPVLTRIDDKINIDPLSDKPDPQIPLGSFSVRWSAKLVPAVSGEHNFALSAEGTARIYINGKLLLQTEGRKAPAIKSGQFVNFDKMHRDKRERVTATATLEAAKQYDIVAEYSYIDGNALVRLDWYYPSPEIAKTRAAEMEMIRNSDVVIAALGIGLDDEREGKDRENLDLPYDQMNYIKQVLAVNPKTIAVLINGSPLSVNWIDENVPAVVEAWYPGEQGGNGIADVLFGDYNPGGRLPMTFYKSVVDLPPFDDYEVSKGRTYMYFTKQPLYPFGYGLSYTTFQYSNLAIDKKKAKESDTITISVDVKNTGSRDGDEVVQLYVRDVESSVKQPLKQLKGFKRVHIKKGETKTVEIPLAVKDLNFWDVDANRFVVESGEFEIQIGASSSDIRLSDSVLVEKKI
ncbi:MAG: glycoside hydrolase family 3 C-terminal domain-containing protein [bacterium]